MSCFVILTFALYLLFPPFSPVDYETDAAGAPFDYGVDEPSFLPEQPGKPPLDHQISPILLSTACIRVVCMFLLSVNPILLHSLSLLLQLWILYLLS